MYTLAIDFYKLFDAGFLPRRAETLSVTKIDRRSDRAADKKDRECSRVHLRACALETLLVKESSIFTACHSNGETEKEDKQLAF